MVKKYLHAERRQDVSNFYIKKHLKPLMIQNVTGENVTSLPVNIPLTFLE